MSAIDVVVLLGSRFAALEHHGTRWRAVLDQWSRDPRVARLDVVDYPRLRPGPVVVKQGSSWLPTAQLHDVTVPVLPAPTPLDAVAWRLVGRALRRRTRGNGTRRVAVAATPLWTPVLAHLDVDRRCFDAVDDWRELPSVAPLRARVEAGYRAARRCDVTTSVTAELERRLTADFAVPAVVQPNGVDLASYRRDSPAPSGLPDEPFAVYVGSVQSRVDLDLLTAVAKEVSVVVAGPADDAAAVLRSGPMTWLGPVDVALVPGLLQRAAVGLLPHRVDAFTASMDPMKLLEYLAAGLPVVSTPLPGTDLSDRVRVAEHSDAFCTAVRELLALPRGGIDPAVLDRDWSVIAGDLLDLYVGAP